MDLNIAEKLVILIWDKNFSTIPILARPGLGDAIKIALVEDLRLRGKISIDFPRFAIVSDVPTKDVLLDEIYGDLRSWKSPFRPREMIWRVFDQLGEKGAFRKVPVSLDRRYLITDPAIREGIVEDLRAFVKGTSPGDPHAPVLLALLHIRNALFSAFPLGMHFAAMAKRAKLVTKMQLELMLQYSREVLQMRVLDPELGRLWESAMIAYDQEQYDSFLINAFPVFEKSIRKLYQDKIGGEQADMRKCIDALSSGKHLAAPIRALHWVWTVRNKKLHEGITLATSDITSLKGTIDSVVKACFNS